MTKLPQKDLLSGSKTPRTTTGEMKNALGKLRDFLSELFGEDSSDKEAVRKALGIDLNVLASGPEMELALSEKAGKEELIALEDAMSRQGIPVGSIGYFAVTSVPAGYLKADGSAVRRETYPDLFAAIGTTFGSGDEETTFNLPDLIDRFAQGSLTPGLKREAGLPDITGYLNRSSSSALQSAFEYVPGEEHYASVGGAFSSSDTITGVNGMSDAVPDYYQLNNLNFVASDANPIYGASNTVQPPALTLLPCIKTFDAATPPGLIDVTALADDVKMKLDKAGGRMNGAIYFGESGYTGVGYDEYGQIVLTSKGDTSPASLALGNDGCLWTNGSQIHYVTEAYNDGTNWFRRWSDGWLEQGGRVSLPGNNGITIALMRPYSTFFNAVASPLTNNTIFYQGNPISVNSATLTVLSIGAYAGAAGTVISWQACGR